ncbi:MAG: DUF4956 domain-containing protein [Coriobacteriales bacterium]|nr:DUF4956 domain-containing protein [Coriobacteriales bacterium]
MWDIFGTILPAAQGTVSLGVGEFLICSAVSLLLGLAAAGIYMFRNSYNKGFVVTLALLPAVVQLVIMLVNGNLGAGLAVMGAFALVRFRSIPGSSRDIAAVFFSMAIGLATGMGFLALAALFTLIIGAASMLYARLSFGEPKVSSQQLRVTIPETLDYAEVFSEVFDRYTVSHELQRLKTSNLGSLYKLYYRIVLRSDVEPKSFLDELRIRNGNLEIEMGRSIFREYDWEL